MDRLDVDLQCVEAERPPETRTVMLTRTRGSQRHASLLDTRNHITAKLRKKPPPGQELGPRVDTVHVYEDGDFISTYELKKQQEKASSEGASDVQREKKS